MKIEPPEKATTPYVVNNDLTNNPPRILHQLKNCPGDSQTLPSIQSVILLICK